MRAFAQLSQRQTFSSTAEGRRALIRWLRKHRVGKAAMEASGGYERDWAKALREARIEVRIVDPKRVRSFARSAGRLAKNDPIDAEMIAWFAETFTEAPGQAYDAARERLVKIVNARQGLLDHADELEKQWRAFRAGCRAENAGAALEEDCRRSRQARGCDRSPGQSDTAFCRARRDHRERAGTWQDHVRRTDRDDAGTGPGERQYRRGLAGGSALR